MKISPILVPLLTGCALGWTFPAAAAEPGEQVNKAPSVQDWAALANLPDLSGVWSPGPLDRFPPGSKTAPPWKPEQAAQIAALQKQEDDGNPHNIYVNCLPEGLPSSVTQTLNSVEFLVTPGRVTVLGEFDGNRLRRIWTDGRQHPADPDPTFSGHSIGRWEKGVLIVDTVGFLPQVFIPMGQGVGLPNNGDMRVEERIYLTGPDRLQVDLIVHAPRVLTGPWHASRTFTRHREQKFDLVESSCRQGDYLDDVDVKGNAVFTAIPKDAGGAPVPPDQAQAPNP
ncbi:hypothetical protein [Sphingobium bisphenolivorans]|uniref:hypothetical protein n=1 Tax=Sphingobium bisphenolivorans TaxID=1335760 RepID=UPI00039F8A34|nr:hypothetical protein [Sphingobium bisphenolivorans]